jgi:hypothetical protein
MKMNATTKLIAILKEVCFVTLNLFNVILSSLFNCCNKLQLEAHFVTRYTYM